MATILALEIDLLGEESSSKKVERLFHLHRSAMKRDTIDALWKRQTATSPNALAAVLLSDSVIDAARKEIRRSSGFNPDLGDIRSVVVGSVIRPELL
ncbi:glucosaminyltransferase [Leifsonia xyli subsp. cynodontis DSM 46306]|uniref:Uncharacterized protein n=1 Tax=Leifsonia xyli subsp. cynodontis DSM 46306 TaxID=1389489 RepID=U3PCT9_LEIXC|nr:hypothetical protein [Leifsonia xyli]AGW42587.1 glucosaminyltransferase [Leifsonia xyli subsp. cynodontis DSM 46306]